MAHRASEQQERTQIRKGSMGERWDWKQSVYEQWLAHWCHTLAPRGSALPERPPTSIFLRFLASRIQTVSFPAVGT